MTRSRRSILAAVASALLLGGCAGKSLTSNQKTQATQQWNAARAGALANLAADQLNDGNLDKCQQTIDQALQLQPDDVSLRLLAAKLAIEQNRMEDADAHLAVARKLAPKNAEAHYLTGVLLERWQQPAAARAEYAAAFENDSTEVAYLMAEAEMLVALGKVDDALALLQAKTATFDHSGPLRDEIGQLLAGQKKYDDAVVALRDASRLATEDATVREHLAFTLFAAKRYAEAADVFERLVRLSDYAQRADVFAALGESQARSQHFADARTAYQKATDLVGTSYGYWLGLAKVTTQCGDPASAETAVRRAIAIDPDSNEAQCLLGYVRLQQNQYAGSLEAFRTASELDHDDSVSVCLQGYVLARMGHPSAAEACYARAKQMNPDSVLAARLSRPAVAQN